MRIRNTVVASHEEVIDRDVYPEKSLLAAILDRAIRDLTKTAEVKQKEVRDALRWFRGDTKHADLISFEEVQEQLNLGHCIMTTINQLIVKASNHANNTK